MINEFEDSYCAKCVTKVLCKIPCVIVCFLVGGDTYLLVGYSRLVLMDEIGVVLTFFSILLYLICISLLLTSYFRCMLTSCAVEDNPPPPDFDPEQCPKCEKCGNFKPPRTHHCSLCGTCTLKMDHHCPWVGNCVGLNNYKFFLIFLFWVSISAAIYATLTGAAMFKSYKSFGSMIGAWTVLSLFITASFALSVGGFFFFHVHLLKENKTTLENMKYKRQQTPYQRKKPSKESFNDVFGEDWRLWFIPTVTLQETGYELYNDGVGASLIQNDYNKYNVQDSDENEVSTTTHRAHHNNIEQKSKSDEDATIVNRKPIDIGPDRV
eukprot:280905_1